MPSERSQKQLLAWDVGQVIWKMTAVLEQIMCAAGCFAKLYLFSFFPWLPIQCWQKSLIRMAQIWFKMAFFVELHIRMSSGDTFMCSGDENGKLGVRIIVKWLKIKSKLSWWVGSSLVSRLAKVDSPATLLQALRRWEWLENQVDKKNMAQGFCNAFLPFAHWLSLDSGH